MKTRLMMKKMLETVIEDVRHYDSFIQINRLTLPSTFRMDIFETKYRKPDHSNLSFCLFISFPWMNIPLLLPHCIKHYIDSHCINTYQSISAGVCCVCMKIITAFSRADGRSFQPISFDFSMYFRHAWLETQTIRLIKCAHPKLSVKLKQVPN